MDFSIHRCWTWSWIASEGPLDGARSHFQVALATSSCVQKVLWGLPVMDFIICGVLYPQEGSWNGSSMNPKGPLYYWKQHLLLPATASWRSTWADFPKWRPGTLENCCRFSGTWFFCSSDVTWDPHFQKLMNDVSKNILMLWFSLFLDYCKSSFLVLFPDCGTANYFCWFCWQFCNKQSFKASFKKKLRMNF